MNKSFKYLPQGERKKILLICDDIRVHSGVATVARELVINTAQHFNWVNVGGAIKHQQKGKRFDLSQDTNKNTGLDDSSVILYPVDGYGSPDLVRQLIKADDYPAPLYNKSYYESCDALLAISKQTKLINELVLGDKAKRKVIEYVPHGLNPNIFKPVEEWNEDLKNFKSKIFNNQEKDFVLFFNSRNIRRKQIPDTMLAFKYFLDKLPKEKADKCCFILHTEVISEHGTDLEAVRKLLFKDYPNAILFSTSKLSGQDLNYLYNIADAQILLTSNEGWGLTLTESILAGTPIIANVTGGMQDQMGFEDEDGNWFEPTPEIPSNHTGRYKKHGNWAFPVYPTNRSIQGSPKTPYIFDDRCTSEDACDRIYELYQLGRQKRKELGLQGRDWAVNKVGLTGVGMGERAINAIDKLFDTWTPREKYELINVNEVKEDTINHEFLY